jgi:hypothetical protein
MYWKFYTASIAIMLLIIVGVGWGVSILEADQNKTYSQLAAKHK